MPASRPRQVPIAVVGIGALMPGEHGAGGFWRTVVNGRDLMTEVPATRWLVEDYYDPDPTAPDKTYARRGAFLSDVEFDPMAFGILPNSLAATDTVQLLALTVAEQVLTDTGGLGGTDRDRVSVILGAGATELFTHMTARIQRPVWLKALRENGIPEVEAQAVCDSITGHYTPWQESTFPGLLGNVIAGRIANRFDLHGTNHVTDAACASSFAALSTAASELSLGRADLVIGGGVDASNDAGTFMCFSKTPALSPSGDCRPFSDAADGTMLGEGIAMYALKRLADAERAGDRVYAVIRGSAPRRTAGAARSTRRSPKDRPGPCDAPTRTPATDRRPWNWWRRTAPAPERVTPPSSPRCARSSRSPAGRKGSGAPSVRSSPRSATPRAPPVPSASSRASWPCTTRSSRR